MILISAFFKNLQEAQKALAKDAIFLFDIHQVIFHRKGLFPFFRGFKKTQKKSLVIRQGLRALIHPETWKTLTKRLKEQNHITESYLDAAKQFPFLHNELLEFSNNIYTPNQSMKTIFKILSERGHKMYLLSNIGNATLKKLKLDYPDYFAYLTETENLINRTINTDNLVWKPQMDAYQQALKVIGQKETAHLTLFVDDKLKNVHAAHKAGINAIKFCNQAQFEQDLKKIMGIVL